jgi:Restriction endonuclease EcoRV
LIEKESLKDKLEEFFTSLKNHISTDDGQWTVKGFIDIFKNVYTVSSDTKIVLKILEIHLFPKILEFAQANGYKVVLAEHQNYYPDISFVKAMMNLYGLLLILKPRIVTPRSLIYPTVLRWVRMANTSKIAPAQKISNFLTVHIQAIFV